MPFFFILDKKKKLSCTDKTANTATSLLIFQSSFVVYKGPVVAVASCSCIIKKLPVVGAETDCKHCRLLPIEFGRGKFQPRDLSNPASIARSHVSVRQR